MTRSSRTSPEAPRDAVPLRLQFIGHATALIEIAGLRVLTDPFLRSRLGPLVRHGPVPRPDELDVDVVIVSHGHPDHFDRHSIAELPGRPTIVVPEGLAEPLRRRGISTHDIVEVAAGRSVVLGGRLTIGAVPARHWISPGATRAKPIGYVLDAGPRVYFAGDTGYFPEMVGVVGDVDLALVPVWTWGPHLGPGHLGPRAAAEVVQELTPRAVVPIHWGTLYPRMLHRVWHKPLREPGDRFATWVRSLAPDVDVRVLRPGDSTDVDVRSAPPRER